MKSLFISDPLQRNSASSFSGCLKDLQLNGHRLSSAAETFGVTPCYEGLSEAGTYFSEGGGYVVLGLFPAAFTKYKCDVISIQSAIFVKLILLNSKFISRFFFNNCRFEHLTEIII